MSNAPIIQTITYKGQPYVDEPVYAEPKRIDELEYAVGLCFNSVHEMGRRQKPRIQVAWQMVRLNWITPGAS